MRRMSRRMSLPRRDASSSPSCVVLRKRSKSTLQPLSRSCACVRTPCWTPRARCQIAQSASAPLQMPALLRLTSCATASLPLRSGSTLLCTLASSSITSGPADALHCNCARLARGSRYLFWNGAVSGVPHALVAALFELRKPAHTPPCTSQPHVSNDWRADKPQQPRSGRAHGHATLTRSQRWSSW